MLRSAVFGLACVASCCVFADDSFQTPSGNACIRGKYGSSEIVITTSGRFAGAIDSLNWDGKEFIDSRDHGRELQSAASFGYDSPKTFCAECFNPTEAGSRADGTGDKSSSRLLSLSSAGSELRTTSRMAFWLAPGEQSDGQPALNDQVLSDYFVSKIVHVGYKNLANVIRYDVTFTLPKGEHHTFAQFEAVSGYMPAEFGRFWKFQTNTGKLQALSDGPGEQELPMVFASEDGRHAVGIFSPEQPSRGYESAGYGRFQFRDEKVVKWNCVFRERNANGISPGKRSFRLFVVIGSTDDVARSLTALVHESRARSGLR